MFTAIGAILRRARRQKQRGQTLVIFAGGLVAFIGIVGLAIDAGRGYVVSAQLSKAVDAAVLAGAKASGTDQDVERAVQRVMKINFPVNYMGSDGQPRGTLQIDRNYLDTATGHTAKRIDYSASIPLPTTFLRVLNIQNMTITKRATALRLVLDIIIVADRSSSIGPVAFQVFKNDVKDFLNIFDPTEDRVAMLTYAGSLTWLQRMRATRGFDKDQLTTDINNAEMAGFTASGPAMWAAWQELINAPVIAGQQNRWKVILFFTDGTPNTVHLKLAINPDLGLNFGRCNDIRRPVGTTPWCGALDCPEVSASPGVHIMAGEMDHPYKPARQYIFGLFRNISRPQMGQEYDVYDTDRGFLREPGGDRRDEYRAPNGSLISAQDPLITGGADCADPRYVFGFGSEIGPTNSADLRYYNRGVPQRPRGREVPLFDFNGIPLGPVTRDTQLVSGRDINFPVPYGNTKERWTALRKKINAAARNNLENIADQIRQPRSTPPGFDQGITIYTIGLDGQFQQMTRPNSDFNGELGRDICQRVANVPAAGRYYNPNQPEGLYVEANSERDLGDAFRKVANAILRLLN